MIPEVWRWKINHGRLICYMTQYVYSLRERVSSNSCYFALSACCVDGIVYLRPKSKFSHVAVGSSSGKLSPTSRITQSITCAASLSPQWQVNILVAAAFRCSGRGQDPGARQSGCSTLSIRTGDAMLLHLSSEALVRRVIAEFLQNAPRSRRRAQYHHLCILLGSCHKAPSPLRRELPRPRLPPLPPNPESC